MGWSSIFARQMAEAYRLRLRLSNMKTERLTKCVYLHAKSFQQSEETYLVNILKAHDIDIDLKGLKSKQEIKNHVKTVATYIDNINQQK